MLLKSDATREDEKGLRKEKIGAVFARIGTQLAELNAILREMRSCCRNTDPSREREAAVLIVNNG